MGQRHLLWKGQRRAGLRLLALASIAGAAVLGATPAGAASHRITVAKYGFSLVLPVGWSQVSLAQATVGTLVGSPTVAAIPLVKSEATSAASKGLKFFAVASADASATFVPNINVGLFKSVASLTTLDKDIKATWTQIGATQIGTKVVHLSFGKAIEGTYEIPATTTTQAIWETQIYALHRGQVYVTTFGDQAKPSVELTAAAVMETWRFADTS